MNLRTAIVAAALAAAAAPASAVTYLPVGPQKDVSISTVTAGGWTLCYSALFGTPFGTSAATTLAACTGERLLLAGRLTGSDNLLVLAQTTVTDALNPTGAADNGVFTTSNGADWFYNDGWSWGFKPIGVGFTKFQCAFGPPDASICIHTLDFVGGFSVNTVGGLNGSVDYEKLVFTSGDVVVPAPATLALLGLGLGLVALGRRRG
jgi:hypothetical protein